MNGTIIQGLDIIDILKFITKKNKKFQAIFLNDLEEVLNSNSDEYRIVRKLYLDSQNNFTRSILRAIFGDVEDIVN